MPYLRALWGFRNFIHRKLRHLDKFRQYRQIPTAFSDNLAKLYLLAKPSGSLPHPYIESCHFPSAETETQLHYSVQSPQNRIKSRFSRKQTDCLDVRCPRKLKPNGITATKSTIKYFSDLCSAKMLNLPQLFIPIIWHKIFVYRPPVFTDTVFEFPLF